MKLAMLPFLYYGEFVKNNQGDTINCNIIKVFVFNTNLTFLYNIDIKGFEKFQHKIKLPIVGIELKIATITGLEF